MFSKLSEIACDIMCMPASSAPVERVFSVSREASRGKRNRIMDYNLERETLLCKNKKYLQLWHFHACFLALLSLSVTLKNFYFNNSNTKCYN